VKAANRNQIQHLEKDSDDVIAFYTGLASPDSDTPNRYIIGYFTIKEIIDFVKLIGDESPLNENDRVIVDDLPIQNRRQVEEKLTQNQANAHVKRYQASGTIDPNLMIVDGKEPGGLIAEPYPISRTVSGGHGFTYEFEEQFKVQTTKEGRETGWLGGFKKSHRLDVPGYDFITEVTD